MKQRRNLFFIALASAILTIVSLNAALGNRYHRYSFYNHHHCYYDDDNKHLHESQSGNDTSNNH